MNEMLLKKVDETIDVFTNAKSRKNQINFE